MGPKMESILELVKNSSDSGIAKEKIQEITKATNSAVYSAIHGLREEGYKIAFKGGVYFYKGKDDTPQLARSEINKVAGKAIDLDKKAVGNDNAFNIPRMLASRDLIDDLSRLSEEDRRSFLDHAKQALFYWKSAINIVQANKSMREFAKEIGLSPEHVG